MARPRTSIERWEKVSSNSRVCVLQQRIGARLCGTGPRDVSPLPPPPPLRIVRYTDFREGGGRIPNCVSLFNDRSVFLSVQKIYALPHEDSNEYSDSQYRFRQWWQWKYMQAVKGDQRVKIVQEHKGDISM